MVPEAGLQIGYDLTDWLRFTASYSALYWSQVARPGEQVRALVNPAQVPSSLQFGQPGSPGVPPGNLNRDGLWVNGVSFGVMLKY